MDLAHTLQTIEELGPTYWVAAGAVALGLTLLFTAGALQLRRWRATRPSHLRLPRRRPRPRPEPAAVPPVTRAAADAYAASTAPVSGDAELARRLAAAAERLEALHGVLAAAEQLPDGSALKPAASHVEYVFRSGEA